VTGGLFFGHEVPGGGRQEHEDLIAGAAGVAAVAVDNARLFQAVERELAEPRRTEALLQQANSSLEERVVAEVAERTRAEQALRQSLKMEALGQVTRGIAHDFNNLLQIVSGNLHFLAKDVVGYAVAQRKVANALEGVARARSLQVSSSLSAAGSHSSPKSSTSGGVETVRSAGLWNTHVDVVQVENAILNLAINGRDAMDGQASSRSRWAMLCWTTTTLGCTTTSKPGSTSCSP
jgi:hypothetical protein